jgi:hypothetical protein
MGHLHLTFLANLKSCQLKPSTRHRVKLIKLGSKLIVDECYAYVEKMLLAAIDALEPPIPKPLRAKVPAPLDLHLGDSLMGLGGQISAMSLDPNGPVLSSVGRASPILDTEREYQMSPFQNVRTGWASLAKGRLSPANTSKGWACHMSVQMSPTRVVPLDYTVGYAATAA